MHNPTLGDDETKLAEYAAALVDAAALVTADWIRASIGRHAPDLASDQVERAVAEGAAAIDSELRALLATDIAEQRTNPLDVFRRGVRFATVVLRDAGVAPAQRDAFAQSNFPDDIYDLSPASFAAIDPSLHEPGLTWGAAKAHVHLRRRRQG